MTAELLKTFENMAIIAPNYTVAIGDIHGMAEKLEELLAAVGTWLEGTGSRVAPKFVFLGDYIDRGPASLAVITRLRQLQNDGAVCLRGNHEQWMIEACHSEGTWQRFKMNGGKATIRSLRTKSRFEEVQRWMQTLPTFHEDTVRYFVHAGVDPAYSLAEQSDTVRLTISDDFLRSNCQFEKYIVHGHTPTTRLGAHLKQPDVRENRCNLDTDVANGGYLTAAIFNQVEMKPTKTISV